MQEADGGTRKSLGAAASGFHWMELVQNVDQIPWDELVMKIAKILPCAPQQRAG